MQYRKHQMSHLLSGIKVLIVEDEEMLRDLLSDEFKFHGAVTKTANDGRAALELIKKESFDFVISDIRMPDGDGIELLRQTRKLPQAPLVFMCSGVSDLSREGLLKEGASDVFEKPFDLEKLVSAIAAQLKKPKASKPKGSKVSKKKSKN